MRLLRNALAVVTPTARSMPGVFDVCLFILCLPVERHHAAIQARAGFLPHAVQNSLRSPGSKSAFQWVKSEEYSVNLDLGVMIRRSGSPGTDQCKVCLGGDDCIPLNSASCEYYMETEKLLPAKIQAPLEDSNPQLRTEVDSMLYSLIEKYDTESEFKDCIPYVSKYTDCTKETICTGCKTCDCDGSGQWNCTINQLCRPELIKPVGDHKTLIVVLEKLKEFEPLLRRLKRSLDSMYHSYDDDSMSHAQLGEWIHNEPTLRVDSRERMYRMNRLKKLEPKLTQYQYQYQYKNLEPTKTMNRKKNNTTLLNLILNTIIHDTLPQVFKENAFLLESNRVKRAIANNTDKLDIQDKIKMTYAELSEWLYSVHRYGAGEANETLKMDDKNMTDGDAIKLLAAANNATENTDTLFVDPALFNYYPDYLALDDVYNNIAVDRKNYTRRKPLLDHKVAADPEFNMYDDKYYYEETKNVDSGVKQLVNELAVTEVPGLSGVTEDITDYYLETVTEVVVDLLASAKMSELGAKNEVYKEVNNKIDNPNFNNDEPNAINVMKRDVTSTKDNMNPNNFNNTTTNTSSIPVANISSSLNELQDGVLDPIDKLINDKKNEMEELLNIRNKLITFIKTHKDDNLTNFNENYMSVYQVEFLPHHHHEINYMRRSNVTILDTYLAKLKRDVYEIIRDIVAIRKLYKDTSHMPDTLKFLIKALKHYIYKQGFHYQKKTSFRRNNVQYDIIKGALIKVIELLDRNRPKMNILQTLSPHAKRLLQRVIKKNYIDEFAASGLRVYDPEYNLTDDLRNVGCKWQVMTEKIEVSSIFDRFHYLKMLHLILAVDNAKMNDALALVDFARSRRMIPVNGVKTNDIMTNINQGLEWIKSILFKTKGEVMRRLNNEESKPLNQPTPLNIQKNFKKKDSFLSQIKTMLKKSKKDIMSFMRRKMPNTDIVKEIARKNVEKMNKKRYEDIMTMQKWQNNLNIVRKKRSPGIDRVSRRIKDIIPKYLRGKVSPYSQKKGKGMKKTNMTRAYRKKNGNTTLKKKSSKANSTPLKAGSSRVKSPNATIPTSLSTFTLNSLHKN